MSSETPAFLSIHRKFFKPSKTLLHIPTLIRSILSNNYIVVYVHSVTHLGLVTVLTTKLHDWGGGNQTDWHFSSKQSLVKLLK